MKKVSLLFGIHMHQPVDNFGEAVQEAIELCYKPFFETMIKYPDFKFALHSSGWLLNEIRLKHPDIFENIYFLSKKGAIEWVSAGYYEPVLSAIPSRDRRAQIEMMNSFIKEHFNAQPKGLWLTERVWESSLVNDIAACGIEYAVVDDYHFLSSGFDAQAMDGYYTTEEGGVELKLFPIAKSLRYALPFFNVDNAIDAITACGIGENSAAVIFDDAEKFGLWPKTHEWVYEKRWLEKFVETVLDDEQVTVEHYTSFIEDNRSLGIAYLNNTSYFEMGEWSLQPHQSLAMEHLKQSVGDEFFNHEGVAFIKGGIWKNFFIKYIESNYLHKRMLYFSLQQEHFNIEELETLYKLQTNDVFWHGVFGGLYLPNLRDNAYKYLLTLEKSAASHQVGFEVLDIDKDGYDELKVLTKELSVVFSSKYGASMVEFGSLKVLFNWQNTLMRRQEAYHDKIMHPKEPLVASIDEEKIATIHNEALLIDEDLQSELIYDWHPKYSFIDHISNMPFSLEALKKLTFSEIGDFANQPFEMGEKAGLFMRSGGIYLEQKYDTKMAKEYSVGTKNITLDLECESDFQETLFYAQEFNFHFAHPYKVTFNSQTLEEGFYQKDCSELVIFDDFTEKYLRISMSRECDIYGHILHTISQSESGFEKVAQGVSFILTFPFESKLKFEVCLELSDV